MLALAQIALLITLIVITYQDFKHRAVWWFIFPLAFAIQVYLGTQYLPLQLQLLYGGLNAMLLLLQLTLLSLYFRVFKKQASLINIGLGLGDVLFLVVLAVAFSPINFILFEISTLILALLLSPVLKNKKLVPLAGIMAFSYALVYVFFYFSSYQPYTDLITYP